jgi:hypothetical protein
MTELREFLKRLTDLLEKTEIPYMIAGSVGSACYGHPRATNDVDVVTDPTESTLREFLSRLGSEYCVNEDAAMEAFRRRSMFNIIDTARFWKADLCVKGSRPFDVTGFNRRQRHTILGMDIWVMSPEDVVLSKLDWDRDGGTEQQLRDVAGVLEIQQGRLDMEYVWRWSEELGVRNTLAKLLDRLPKEEIDVLA